MGHKQMFAARNNVDGSGTSKQTQNNQTLTHTFDGLFFDLYRAKKKKESDVFFAAET